MKTQQVLWEPPNRKLKCFIYSLFLRAYQGTGHTKETTYRVLKFKDNTGLCIKAFIFKKNVSYLKNATFPRLFRTQALTSFDNTFPSTESINYSRLTMESFCFA